jgi:hypothetical protein
MSEVEKLVPGLRSSVTSRQQEAKAFVEVVAFIGFVGFAGVGSNNAWQIENRSALNGNNPEKPPGARSA